MGALPADKSWATDGLTVDVLERRLARAFRAREEAESLLESKSREVFDANIRLKKTAASLESQRVQLNTILDHTLAAIFLVRDDLTVLRANKAAVRLFGLGEDYFVETAICDLFAGPTSALDWMKTRLRAGEAPDESAREAIGRRADGTTFPMEFGVTLIASEDKHQTVWIVRDITRRKREEERRLSLERELSQTNKLEALGTLASGVAHEINTPVQYVSDNVLFLKDAFSDLASLVRLFKDRVGDGDPAQLCADFAAKAAEIDVDFLLEEAPQALEQSQHGMVQVASIVKAIKEFSHPGATEKTPTDINDLITTTLTVSRNQWKYVATSETDLAADLPAIPVLPSEINQVLLNLIVNAADAIEDSGKDGLGKDGMGVIRITTSATSSDVVISVSDTGCGMSEDVAARIFDPFFTTKDVGKGTGQGLTLAYNIIHIRHGGTIRIESTTGAGSTFTITLPICPPATSSAHGAHDDRGGA